MADISGWLKSTIPRGAAPLQNRSHMEESKQEVEEVEEEACSHTPAAHQLLIRLWLSPDWLMLPAWVSMHAVIQNKQILINIFFSWSN